MNQGLQPPLDVYGRGRWVDPPGGDKAQRGKRPNKHCADGKPSNKGSEKTFAKRCLGVCVLLFNHTSR
jgi:hypothetical protein